MNKYSEFKISTDLIVISFIGNAFWWKISISNSITLLTLGVTQYLLWTKEAVAIYAYGYDDYDIQD